MGMIPCSDKNSGESDDGFNDDNESNEFDNNTITIAPKNNNNITQKNVSN